MTDSIDIAEPLQEICRRLDLNYNQVKRIEFQPRSLTADPKFMRTNDQGEHESAIEVRYFSVKT